MRIVAGKMYRFKGKPVTIAETGDMCRKAKIRFAGGRTSWIASNALTDY